jgi:hypothetical protein
MLLLNLVEQVQWLVVESAIWAAKVGALKISHFVSITSRVDVDELNKLSQRRRPTTSSKFADDKLCCFFIKI